jgi:hypothetical protein
VKGFSVMLAVTAVSGCTSYQPLALSQRRVEQKMQMPAEKALRVDAAQIHHPLLPPVSLNLGNGIGPDQAAVLAVLLNPTLRADRDRRGLAAAQLVQAGILPNPTIGYGRDFVAGGSTKGTIAAYGFTGSWDISGVVSCGAKVDAARANVQAIDLDIAWTEWQMAQAAKLALYRIIALEEELSRGEQIDEDQQKTVETLQAAVDRHERSVFDLAAAQASREDAHATVLSLKQELDRQRLELKRAIGVLPEATLQIGDGIKLPSSLGGLYEQQQIAFQGLTIVLVSAIVLVILLLLFLYESFRVSIAMLITTLLAVSAVYAGLWITGTEFNVTSRMGMTMIVGIVTEVAIFYYSEFRELPDQENRFVIAGINRMRPIAMTTFAAILALAPLALGVGQGSAMLKPLAIAIISGLIVQLPLALIVLPCLLALFRHRPAGKPGSATAASTSFRDERSLHENLSR